MPGGQIRLIMEATDCDEETAVQLEDIMRDVVFHSTLDWQTREQLMEGARTAHFVLKSLEKDRK